MCKIERKIKNDTVTLSTRISKGFDKNGKRLRKRYSLKLDTNEYQTEKQQDQVFKDYLIEQGVNEIQFEEKENEDHKKTESEVFDKEYDILFEKAQELKKIFLENELADWYSCIIHLDESNKLSVDFDYSPWLESDFGPTARMDFFEYKYLGKQPENEKELEQFKAMEAFQREHNGK